MFPVLPLSIFGRAEPSLIAAHHLADHCRSIDTNHSGFEVADRIGGFTWLSYLLRLRRLSRCRRFGLLGGWRRCGLRRFGGLGRLSRFCDFGNFFGWLLAAGEGGHTEAGSEAADDEDRFSFHEFICRNFLWVGDGTRGTRSQQTTRGRSRRKRRSPPSCG